MEVKDGESSALAVASKEGRDATLPEPIEEEEDEVEDSPTKRCCCLGACLTSSYCRLCGGKTYLITFLASLYAAIICAKPRSRLASRASFKRWNRAENAEGADPAV